MQIINIELDATIDMELDKDSVVTMYAIKHSCVFLVKLYTNTVGCKT
jgi:hypothetical protein